ncbi:hypothetical protein F889_02152 [Acinetobacter colistiniresistens]|uniref:Uncharacterized protein n=2 Tax=Acinetobacter TaxID=469 RepID=N9R2X2_9GAMM|nr:hypothetical protein [Acinetobacter colistiniresistens]ENX33492.1 hypothetical protein F889_02152 [Acinetobacter colistiniresistens]
MNEQISPNMYIKPDYSAQVAKWLAEGNQIKSLEQGEGMLSKKFNNREVRSPQAAMKEVMAKSVAVQREKIRARQDEDKATREEVLAMGKWLDAKSGRAKKLTQMLGCAPSRVSQIKLFTRSCSKDQMKLIQGFMKAIEKNENVTTRDGEGR